MRIFHVESDQTDTTLLNNFSVCRKNTLCLERGKCASEGRVPSKVQFVAGAEDAQLIGCTWLSWGE